ncbi:glutathione-dependent formaldehyde-activating protein [Gallaecimonas xiamenensis 3-C-1]|uniref:Glutathione-dependent formaldehyde-activating protein n=1 Tax=Gallaecimonas xiamenensis 3-C-1 TaxID=745411 RepID=K2IJC3_9GAMM|nr:glutathione-dependent formaldehyde-activating protein [Gallaecimonas xiamenensis 3-C-1]
MSNKRPSSPLQGSCHCGAVRLTLPAAPEMASSCNCSLCRRTGGIWAYYQLGSVVIQGHPGNTESYTWGDRSMRNFRCKTCGIITHWEPIEPTPGSRHGVNLRNFEPELLASVVVRQFDGADTWQFLD